MVYAGHWNLKCTRTAFHEFTLGRNPQTAGKRLRTGINGHTVNFPKAH